MQTDVQPNYVVEGRIRGSERPDEWVVLGNHHDAWVFGGVDPSSGTASMMELTAALGRLARDGVRPRRTLVFGSWDGEEVTLTGSTEWGEQFAAELKAKAVAYLNVDSSASGPSLGVSAVGTLAPMIEELTGDLTDPSGRSLRDAWRASTADDVDAADRGPLRRRAGRHPHRQRLRSHRVHQPPRRAGRRHELQRPLRRLPLGLRQPLLGVADWRSGLPLLAPDDAALGHDGAAAGQRRASCRSTSRPTPRRWAASSARLDEIPDRAGRLDTQPLTAGGAARSPTAGRALNARVGGGAGRRPARRGAPPTA